MNKIKKAVIPAAGLGTRFLPVTKAVPKELLPIVDVPTLQVILEEAAASGIEDVLLVVSDQKQAIRTHFSPAPELDAFLFDHGKEALQARIAKIPEIVNLHYIVQEEPRGLGHAVSLARDFADGDAIAVLLGDDVVAAEEAIHKDGIVAPAQDLKQDCCPIASLVEKPAAKEAPSNLAILGRYIITPALFDILDATEPGKGNEIQLTDALNTLAAQETMTACVFSGRRYDVGDQLGFIEANIEFGLKRQDIGPALAAYLKDLAARL